MLRFYNPYTYEHLYTPSEEEAASLRAAGWNEEGIGWYSPVKGTQGVETIYRLYNPWGDDHLYTTNAKEKDDCLARGMKLDYKFEAYGFAAKSEVANQPVYRLFNPYEQEHTHFFTTNPSEVSDNVARGWKDEHEQWFVPGKPAETPAEAPAAGTSNVIIGGFGIGSGSSNPSEAPTPSLNESQKAVLQEASKSVEERIKETREAAVTVKNDKGETVKGADAVAILKARSEAATKAVTDAGDKATAEQKQKAAEAKDAYDYANALQALNDAQKAVDDANKSGKATTEQTQKLETAKANVNKIEQVPQVTTVNVSFKDATNKDAKDLPKAGQVSVEFVRATQRWSVHLAQIPQKDERAAFLTEAAAVKAALYQNKTLDTMKQQSSSTSVTKGDKDGEYVVTLNVTMATPTLKPGEVEHTSTSSDPAQETKTQIAKDDKAPKDLPELNLSIFGKDAAASMHAGDKDDSNSVATAKAQLEEQKKAIDAERETIASWREYQVAKELIDTDPSDKNLLDTRDNLKAAFDKEGAAHKKADKDFKVDSKTYIKLEQDMLVQDLKKAEYDYKVAKNDTDKATARKNAVHAAWLIMEKQADLLIGVEQEKGVFEARLNIEHALHDLDVALGKVVPTQKNEALDTYIQALVTFLTDPSAKDAVKTLNAAKEAYENPKKAEPVTPKKQDEKKEGETSSPDPKQGKKVDQGQGNADPKQGGSATPTDKGNSGSQDPKVSTPAKQK